MKLRLPLLLVSAIMACYPPLSAGDSSGVSINFYSGPGNSLSGEDETGMIPVAGDHWFNYNPVSADPAAITQDNSGNALAGVTISTKAEKYSVYSPSGVSTATQTDKLLAAYFDTAMYETIKFTISGVPYLSSNVFVIMSGDGGSLAYSAVGVNGQKWTYKDGSIVQGDTAWGTRQKDLGELTMGVNVLGINSVLSDTIDISVEYTAKGRGTVAGIQVEDAYGRTYCYRKLSEDSVWNGNVWGDMESSGTNPWAGNGKEVAVISSSALDDNSHVLSLAGETVTVAGFWLKQGNVTLNNGTLQMETDKAIRVEDGTKLNVGDDLSWGGPAGVAVAFSGAGTVQFGDNAAFPDIWSIVGSSVKVNNDRSLVASGVLSISSTEGTSLDMGGHVLTVPETAMLSLPGDVTASLTNATVAGAGKIVLTTSFTASLDASKSLKTFFADYGGVLSVGNGSTFRFDDFDGDFSLGKATMTLQVENGATLRFQKAKKILTNLTFEAGSTFYRQDNAMNFQGNVQFDATAELPVILTGYWGKNTNTFVFNGKVSGSGQVRLQDSATGGSWNGIQLDNDENDFSGTWVVNHERNVLNITKDGAASAASVLLNKGYLRVASPNVSIVSLDGEASAHVTSSDESNTLIVQKGTFAGTIGSIAAPPSKLTAKSLNLVKTSEGTLTLSGDLSGFEGTMTVSGGILDVGSTTNLIQESVRFSLNGGMLAGMTLSPGMTLSTTGASGSLLGGVTTLNGGTISCSLGAANLTTGAYSLAESGSLAGTGVTFKIGDEWIPEAFGSYILIGNVGQEWTGTMTTEGLTTDPHYQFSTLYDSSLQAIVLKVRNGLGEFTWTGSANRNWSLDPNDMNWTGDGQERSFLNGASVTFGDTGAGEVVLIGNLEPALISVDSGDSYRFSGTGSIGGAARLVKAGSGILTIETVNSYKGGTGITAGGIVLGNDKALGDGDIGVTGNASLQ